MSENKTAFSITNVFISILVFIICCVLYTYVFGSKVYDIKNIIAGVVGILIASFLITLLKASKKPRR